MKDLQRDLFLHRYCLFKMASEVLKVETQDSIEALQREADELKKRLDDEKAKLKDVESNVL